MSVSHRLREPLCYGAKKKNLWVIPENHKTPPHNNASYINKYDYRSTHCLLLIWGTQHAQEILEQTSVSWDSK